MNFEEMKDAWEAQEPKFLSSDKNTIVRLIRSRSEALRKSNFRIYLASILIGVLAAIWMIACFVVFLSVGSVFLNDIGIIPLPSLLVAPDYIIMLCLCVIFKYKQNERMNKEYENTLRGFARSALAQTISRIQLLRIIPFAMIGLWLVLSVSGFMIPSISIRIREMLPLLALVSVGDVAVIAIVFWWTRRRIRLNYLPKKAELESIIASI